MSPKYITVGSKSLYHVLKAAFCFSFVSFFYTHIVVSPPDIQFGVDVGIAEVMYEVWNER